MLNSQILEVAIGLAFVYLLFCLICSMVKEWIASAWLKSRPKTLFKGIKSLLKDPTIIDEFYKHPLINALAKISPEKMEEKKLEDTLRKQPSSIPSRTFALTVLDLLAPTKDAAVPQTLAHIRNSVSQQTDQKYAWIKKALLPLLDAAQDDLGKAQKNLENWFDDAMERVTGWYKRRTQLYLLILGLFVCIAMNVDTFAIANSLYRDNTLRAIVVAAAQKRAKEPLQPAAPPSSPTKPGEKVPPAAPAAAKAKSPKTVTETKPSPTVEVKSPPPGKEAPAVPGTAAASSAAKEPQKTPSTVQESIAQLQDLNLPIGWFKKSVSKTVDCKEIKCYKYVPIDWEQKPDDPHSWCFKLLGWLFSALAISLGAPFWFDLLNKLVNLRGGGKTPEKGVEAEKKT